MTDDSGEPTPPEGLPEDTVANLGKLTPEELRKAIIHARELLRIHDETERPAEPQPDEDIIRVTEHEGYTEVVKRVPCAEGCSDCPHGPYLYHVTEEPRIEGGTKPHWTFLGEVHLDDEDRQ